VNGKPPHHLWAESIREVGVLFVVFGPLDTVFAGDPNWLVALLICVAGLLFVYIGILLEAE
jgi:hypothetical protein